MKRYSSRETLFTRNKRSRSSVGRYEKCDENITPDRILQNTVRNRTQPNYSNRRDDYGKMRSYKVLCFSNLHPKASDELVEDILRREYQKYGGIMVRISRDIDEERVAYVCFRNCQDAKDAKHNTPRIFIYDKAIVIDPVFESKPSRPRSRSLTPDCDRQYKARSPVPPIPEQFSVYNPPPYIPPGLLPPNFRRDVVLPPLQDFARVSFHRDMPPPMPLGPPPHPFLQRNCSPLPCAPSFPPPHFKRFHFENKRDKFPNYLHHIPPEEDPLATRTLFVGNLKFSISFETLDRIFGRFGIVEDIDIKRPSSGNAFAFVRFQNLDMAHRAKVELSGKFIGDDQCKIGFGKAIPTERIWVGGLGPMTTFSLLDKEFGKFGEIQKIDYMEGCNSAYIQYDSVDAAQAAVKQMRGLQLEGQEQKLRLDFVDLAAPPFPEGVPPGFFYGGPSPVHPFHEKPAFISNYCPPEERQPENNSGSHSPKMKSVVKDPSLESHLSSAVTLKDVARCRPSVWKGALILKNSLFPIKFYLMDGIPDIVESLKDEGGKCVLRVKQRLRLDKPKLDDVSVRISSSISHSVFLGLPRSSTNMTLDDMSVQTRPLRNLVAYLKHKQAAGVVSFSKEESDSSTVLYAFPPCSFSADLLKRSAPSLSKESLKGDFLIILIVQNSTSQ